MIRFDNDSLSTLLTQRTNDGFFQRPNVFQKNLNEATRVDWPMRCLFCRVLIGGPRQRDYIMLDAVRAHILYKKIFS